MNVIIIQSLFAIFFLLIKKAVVCFYLENKDKWDVIKDNYYWFEYVYFFSAAIATPKHNWNEGIITLGSVILIKIAFDKMIFIDKWMCKKFQKNKS